MTKYYQTESGLLVPVAPHIIKRNYVEAEMGHRTGLSGEYRLVVRRHDNSVARDTGWFPNLILDAGLNRLGTASHVSGIAIGTSAVAPAATQTALLGLSAWTTTVQASPADTQQAASPFFTTASRTWRFAVGALNGNFSEVGMGWANNALFSRALITDSGGNPTPITVLSDEQLDVTYRLRAYAQEADWGGTYTIGGSSYTVVGRCSRLNSGVAGGLLSGVFWSACNEGDTTHATAYTGSIGSMTSDPSGTGASVGNTSQIVNHTYVNNSNARETSATWALNDGNLAGGIKSVRLLAGAIHSTQYEFTPAIPKNNTRTFTMRVSASWARRP